MSAVGSLLYNSLPLQRKQETVMGVLRDRLGTYLEFDENATATTGTDGRAPASSSEGSSSNIFDLVTKKGFSLHNCRLRSAAVQELLGLPFDVGGVAEEVRISVGKEGEDQGWLHLLRTGDLCVLLKLRQATSCRAGDSEKLAETRVQNKRRAGLVANDARIQIETSSSTSGGGGMF
ncbi:unnamed protein product [Amoebophrya sp. A25]|nr:unnamed protein product [Amoebophrya sp. A25]|eukprot:GSA25T00023544001.1